METIDTQTSPESSDASSAVDLARDWLARFASAVERGDAESLRPLFVVDSFWRDRLAFTWDLRSLHGIDQIIGTLDLVLPSVGAVDFELDDETVQIDDGLLLATFSFTTGAGPARGVLRLVDLNVTPVAWVVYTSLEGLHTAPEPVGALRTQGTDHGERRPLENWADRRAVEVAFTETEPTVLILGAGQGGLTVAARLKMLGVPTLLVERDARVGDSWRKRYHSLVLHDPVYTNHLPYLPFPEHWPVFTPKDKLADWFETYVATMELNVWTGSEVVRAQRDETVDLWTVDIRRQDGTVRTVSPRHVILATGVSGRPKLPDFDGEDVFAGQVLHSSRITGDEDVKGKKVTLIGAGNSGMEIAHDMWERGAEVTLVQRSSTHVSNGQNLADVLFAGLYGEGAPPTDEADFLASSLPWEAVFDIQDQVLMPAVFELDKDMHEGLKNAGFKWNPQGVHELFLRRGGGYYIDVGAAKLVADGRIKVKSGVEVTGLDVTGVKFADSAHLDSDVVIYATGYQDMRETARDIFGDEVADRCRPVWGLDSEGELSGVWRRSGFDGLWFMGGNMSMARGHSKPLALQIRAIEDNTVPRLERDLILASADSVVTS